MAEDWIEQLRKKTSTEEFEIRKKEGEAKSKAQKEEELYIRHKPAIERKIEEIKAYVSEVNKAGGKNIEVEQRREDFIKVGYLPGIEFVFSGDAVKVCFMDLHSRNSETEQWKYAQKTFPVESITRERFMSWMKWVAGMGKPPYRLILQVDRALYDGAIKAVKFLIPIGILIALIVYLLNKK